MLCKFPEVVRGRRNLTEGTYPTTSNWDLALPVSERDLSI
jgi:hypothetical protein